jgi:hypothetical protein
MAPDTENHARFLPGQRAGHYESFFQRANHPSRPLAFWIRYTLFSPAGRPEAGIGELWAVFFDGETGTHVAVKREVPIAHARFDRERFAVSVDDARLDAAGLAGSVEAGGHRIAWDLRYHGDEPPLLLFPRGLYDAPLPRAKSLVGLPMALHEGTLHVDGRAVDVGGWVGSQNHNWGSQHTDHYAWGQVAGFDTHPGSFLEIATARLKLGPVWTPFMTPVVLRHEGREHAANTPLALLRAHGAFDYFTWRFRFETDEVRASGYVAADRADFVGLSYLNPPGGTKQCLNTKIATASLTLVHKAGPRRGCVDDLFARRRAAFEILTDDRAHGVPMPESAAGEREQCTK